MISLADTLDEPAPYGIADTIAETLTLSDTLTPNTAVSDTIADSITLMETLQATINVPDTTSLTLTLVDTITAGINQSSILFEQLTLADHLTSPNSVGAVPIIPEIDLPVPWIIEAALTGRTEHPV